MHIHHYCDKNSKTEIVHAKHLFYDLIIDI